MAKEESGYRAQMLTAAGRWVDMTDEPDSTLDAAEERAEHCRTELLHPARVVDAATGAER